MSRKNNLSRYGGVEPKKVNGQLNLRAEFYRSELRKLVKGLFDIKCPESWDKDYILDNIIDMGYLIVTDTDFGVLPLRGALQGYNYFGNPTNVIITVPLIHQLHKTIGVDCEMLYLMRTREKVYYTLSQNIRIYAYKLAAADAAIDVNLMNSRVAYMIEAETKAQADTIKLMYDKITDGDPMVVYRKDAVLNQNGMQLFFGNVKNTYIADMVQDSKRTIINEFLTSIGINNANTDKRERLNADEVNANNDELLVNTNRWKENLNECCDKINRMFGIDFSMKLKFDASNRKEIKDDADRQHKSVETSESE